MTDLAQSESSLAGANANLIKAKTELLASKTNFQRVTGELAPNYENLNEKVFLTLPDSLDSSLKYANLNNIDLLISQLNKNLA